MDSIRTGQSSNCLTKIHNTLFFLVRITIDKLNVEYLNIVLIIAARSRNTREAKNFLKCLTPDLEIKTVQGAISRHCLIAFCGVTTKSKYRNQKVILYFFLSRYVRSCNIVFFIVKEECVISKIRE